MNPLLWLFDAQIRIGDQVVLWREVLGNVFGLLSALGGMRRRVWAWPVGIAGNVLLFTVFLGAVFDTPHPVNLLGQAGRQVMFVIVSAYGWWRWSRRGEARAFSPRWASWPARIGIVVVMVGGTLALTPLFRALGSYEPVWSDAWIFVGSLLATYGMARGWVEFWLIWVAVDAVGVPLLFSAGYYASGAMYAFYGAFTIFGFVVWARSRRPQRVLPGTQPATAGVETASPAPDRAAP
ncbi:nicotinamide riboside transporter PnuC [Pseudolysinimonas sp.]|uniref:nicotinamide riboside transporter PnuC n=1 Tax=Pseudolysinimonas sp. TaxID=2680009 RepID=UPI003F808D66